MHRRSLLVGMAALTLTGTASAQEATPAIFTTPRDLLVAYLAAVIRDGDLAAIPDYFDLDALDFSDVTRDQVEMRSNIDEDDGPVTMDVRVVLGDSEEAIALVRFWSNDYNSRELFIAVRMQDGKIIGYRYMYDSSLAA